ncbi:MAG: MATE family efflux transporter [Desulfobulbaceae bacterium]
MREVWNSWKEKSRYREVSKVCLPLVMGMAATMVMEFTDRIFLSNYSVEAISAALPAGVTAFLCMIFLGGIGGYVSVFIAQYSGTGQNEQIGVALWQGLYFCLFAGIVLFAISLFAARPLFLLAGHPPEVRALEEIYFNILCRGAIFHVLAQTISGFFTGRGMTRPVMVCNIVGMAINIPLDYALINGVWGMPEMGIAGAGLATVISWAIIVLLLALMIFTRENDRLFKVCQGSPFNRVIFLRLMRFGVPGSLQFSLDIFAFTFFILMVGRLGKEELAASNIVISISSLAFMPALGFSHGISCLVGQALGGGRPQQARHVTWSGIHLLLAYILFLDCFLIFSPELILSLFIPQDQGTAEYAAVVTLGSHLLRIVAVYVCMDVFYMIFSGVLRGAGDTRFIMWSIGTSSLFCMLLPLYIGIEFFDRGLSYAWSCVLLFVAVLCLLASYRYRQGKWQSMLVVQRKREDRCAGQD